MTIISFFFFFHNKHNKVVKLVDYRNIKKIQYLFQYDKISVPIKSLHRLGSQEFTNIEPHAKET